MTKIMQLFSIHSVQIRSYSWIYKAFDSPVSSEIFDLLLFVSYISSQSNGIRFDDYFFLIRFV